MLGLVDSSLLEALLQALAQLRKQLLGLSLPYQPDESTQQWYLRDRSYDVNEAAEKLSKMCRWRHSFRPDLIRTGDIQAELAADKAFVHDLSDRFGRPVVVVQARRHIVSEAHRSSGARFSLAKSCIAKARMCSSMQSAWHLLPASNRAAS